MEEDKTDSEAQEQAHLSCLRCGRGLKNSESRKIGYGPVCVKKIARNKGLRDFE